MTLRYVRPVGGNITSMRGNMKCGPLGSLGNAILVWVNEADFLALNPINLEEDKKQSADQWPTEKDRAEYERLKAKLGLEE